MLITIIPLVLIGVSIVTLLVIVLRKIPLLRVLNVASDPEVKVKALKQTIVAQRLERVGRQYRSLIKKMLSPLAGGVRFFTRATVKKLTDLEAHYQQLRRQSSSQLVPADALQKLVQEAEQLMKDERYGEAEKKLIEVLSHDPKNASAYEDLGMLYMDMKQYDQAEETFLFLIKMHPEDPSVLTSLGEIALEREETEKALGYFEKAMNLRPNNPKYIDFFIEAALQAEDIAKAEQGVKHLRQVNPENQKLDEFLEQIKILKKNVLKAAGQESE